MGSRLPPEGGLGFRGLMTSSRHFICFNQPLLCWHCAAGKTALLVCECVKGNEENNSKEYLVSRPAVFALLDRGL